MVQLIREGVLPILQQRIRAFHKQQLFIYEGYNLLRSIVSFAIAVKFVCRLSTFVQVSFLLSRLLLTLSENCLLMYVSVHP